MERPTDFQLRVVAHRPHVRRPARSGPASARVTARLELSAARRRERRTARRAGPSRVPRSRRGCSCSTRTRWPASRFRSARAAASTVISGSRNGRPERGAVVGADLADPEVRATHGGAGARFPDSPTKLIPLDDLLARFQARICPALARDPPVAPLPRRGRQSPFCPGGGSLAPHYGRGGGHPGRRPLAGLTPGFAGAFGGLAQRSSGTRSAQPGSMACARIAPPVIVNRSPSAKVSR